MRPKLSITQVAELIQRAGGRTSIITGAGISTESGIPDYRGKNGRYQQSTTKPMTHQEFMGNESNRKRFWSRAIVGFKSFDNAQPNRSHNVLSELEKRRWINGIITQNVDRLHHKAGSSNVVELHGRGDMLECMTCNAEKSRNDFHQELIRENDAWLKQLSGKSFVLTADGDAIVEGLDLTSFFVPNCEHCSIGTWKPAYVFFGGSVPVKVAEKASNIISDSNITLLIGSTASTFSCVRLIRKAYDQGSMIGIINQGMTRVDEYAIGKYEEGSCGAFLESLLQELTK